MASTIDTIVPPMAKASDNVTLANNSNQLIMDEEPFTPIQKFYDNCNIFITGGTGFLGKSKNQISCDAHLKPFMNWFGSSPVWPIYSFWNEFTYILIGLFPSVSLFRFTVLINKLLTACSSLDTIYLLVRNKKGKDVHSRIEDIFDDPVSMKFYTRLLHIMMTFILSIHFPWLLFFFSTKKNRWRRMGSLWITTYINIELFLFSCFWFALPIVSTHFRRFSI